MSRFYVPPSITSFVPYYWPAEQDMPIAALVYDLARQSQPSLVVAPAMSDGAVYLALCQALHGTAADALAYGYYSCSPEEEGKAEKLQKQTLINNEYFSGFSYLRKCAEGESPLPHFAAGSIKLLLLDNNTHGDIHAWLPLLAQDGIAVARSACDTATGFNKQVLNLATPVTLIFGEHVSGAQQELFAVLEADGAENVSAFYRHTGEFLRLRRTRGRPHDDNRIQT